MNRWERVGRAEVPGGGGVMDLLRAGAKLAIHVDGRELMNSEVHGSEDALAELGCAHLRGRDGARVLVGGLGMGFTLAAALRVVGPGSEVVVAELVPEVVAWSRGPVGPVAGHPLDDPRTAVIVDDVAAVIRANPGGFDAILLDVDNGPEGLTRASNDWLYRHEGLAATRAALRPGGVVAWWSAAPNDAFTRRLGHARFRVDEQVVRSRGAKGGHRHTIWFGRAG